MEPVSVLLSGFGFSGLEPYDRERRISTLWQAQKEMQASSCYCI